MIKPIGKIGLRDERVNDLMLIWSKDNDFWVRRVAIEHQLLRKDKMNIELLEKILENNLNSSEFFLLIRQLVGHYVIILRVILSG